MQSFIDRVANKNDALFIKTYDYMDIQNQYYQQQKTQVNKRKNRRKDKHKQTI